MRDIPFTETADGEVCAVDTAAALVVAYFSVSIAFALSAVGESPEPSLTLVAHASICVWCTQTLAILYIAEIISGAYRIAVAS